MISDKKKNTRNRGQGLIEFALVVPILLLLVFGIIEIGRLLFIYIATTNASREVSRYGSSIGDNSSGVPRYLDCDGMRDLAAEVGFLANITPDSSKVVIKYDRGVGFGNTPLPYSLCPPNAADVVLGDRIIVEVQADYSPIVPLLPFGSFPVRSVSARSIVKNVFIATGIPAPTATNTSTLTNTPTQTTTRTPTPTFTATACTNMEVVSWTRTGSNRLDLVINNNSGATINLQEIYLDWNDQVISGQYMTRMRWGPSGSLNTFEGTDDYFSPNHFDWRILRAPLRC